MSNDNLTTTAVALTWDGNIAPVVSAQGLDSVAEQIVAMAKEHNIPLHEDAQLAQLLMTLELGEEIPEELYIVIAKVIAFAYYVSGRTSVLGEQEF
ncbi:Flagellar biosynthesis protein FlhB [hydrothermal vent metagenome]|uniref:Flagellar biosynthesis protein FlhB n=1 Tax=hydrothermal vent metagenome TaxID=652676 RepID=A0A3B0ZIX4_9ZZZZ